MEHDHESKEALEDERTEAREATVHGDDGLTFALPARALVGLSKAVLGGFSDVCDALADVLTAATNCHRVVVTVRRVADSDRPGGERILDRMSRRRPPERHRSLVTRDRGADGTVFAYERGQRVVGASLEGIEELEEISRLSARKAKVDDGGGASDRFRLATSRGQVDVFGLGVVARRRNLGVWMVSPPDEEFTPAALAAAGHALAIGTPLLEAALRGESLTEANHALHDVAEFLRAMFDQSAVGVVLLDLEGRVLGANPAFCAMLGYAEDELVGMSTSALTPASCKEVHDDRLRSLQDGSSTSEIWEKTCVRKDGRLIDTLVGLSRVHSSSRFADVLIGVVQDVTERKRIEGELLQERERAGITMMAAGVGTWVWLPAEDRIVTDAIFSKMLALSEEAQSSDLATLARAIHPEDLARVSATFLDALDRTSVDIEYRVVGPCGSIRWIFARGQILRDEDGVARAAGVALDITERRQAEEALRASDARYRLAMRATNNAIWDWNVATDEVQWNVAVETLFGHPPETAPQGFESWGRHIHPDDRDRVQRGIREVVELSTGDAWRAEYRFLRADGTYADVLDRGFVLRDRSGRALRMIGALQDLTDRKRAEREREHLLESERVGRVEAERTSQMKDEFLATLSHELRTPLNAMLGWAQILQNSAKKSPPPTSADMARGIEVIERNARAQAQIIEDLLDMSRIISGKVRLDAHPVDVAEVVRGAIETTRVSAEAKGIAMLASVDMNGETVMGDANRLQQVMWNLLSNAVKFTPRGGRVQVVVARVGTHIEISVSDSGQGISEEFLPHVFDRFRQADASTTRKHGGLGLGLAIVKQLVELHGGTVRVESEGTGLGSTFTISLPVLAVLDRGSGESYHYRLSRPDLLPAAVSLDGVRVLVVDDEADARTLIERFLSDAGAVTEAASSAREALERLKTRRFDVLVSDIGMPEQDGYALLRRVRELDRSLPAIALTAYASSDDRVRALVAGFKSHLTKPVEALELIATVGSMVGRT